MRIIEIKALENGLQHEGAQSEHEVEQISHVVSLLT